MNPNVEKTHPAHRYSLRELCDFLQIKSDLFTEFHDFPLLVPDHWLKKIEKGNPYDPLLLQILPQIKEREKSDWPVDAVGDQNATLGQGLIKKYSSRALLISSPACQIHCRYCFRRHFPYQESTKKTSDWARALDELENHPKVNEIILSGGDPLTLPDKRWEELVNLINGKSQIKTLRIHSRSVIIDPLRTTDKLMDILQMFHGKKVLVIHCNHQNELDSQTAESLKLWNQSGWTILNQSVLLKNINDNSTSLVELSNKLFEQGVLPYYLHLLDRVKGTKHFEVAEDEAVKIHQQMAARLPGYLVPRLIREIAGQPNKTIIA